MTAEPKRHDILCLSSIDWDHIWQGHQEIMSMLAADGHRVLFVENTGVRAPALGQGDLERVRKRIFTWWRGTKGFREERPNLFVYSPLLLPFPYNRVARWINSYFMNRALRRWASVVGFHRPILWTFLPTPLALDMIRAIDPQLTIYYCIDDLARSSHGARKIVASEQQLFKSADLVFVTSEKLRQRASAFRPDVHLFPFGVSFERFERVRNANEPPPADIATRKRPIVGYVGGLHQWVDQELVADLARRMPDVTFVLVGPEQVDVSTMKQCSNICFLGQKAHDDVPKYIGAFDVALVPYRIAEYTANVYPTKLNEYMVMGKPVVATDLPEIRRFNETHGPTVRIASTAQGFEDAIRSALDEKTPEAVERRIAVAQQNSWRSRLEQMRVWIDQALEKHAAKEQRWDALLRRAYRRARSHSLGFAMVAAVLYVLIFHTNFAWWVAEPLRLDRFPQRADAIVVFAGGVGESGQAGGGQQERLKQAIDLYNGGFADRIIVSSGFVYSFNEAESMRAVAIAQGIPADRIELEPRARNTYENVIYVREILQREGWKNILLVSSPYHMRRAVMVWNKTAPEVFVTPTPPPNAQFYEHTRGASIAQIRGIAWEYVAIINYWWRGYL
ncbi:MAG TPA: ElyC/SanA/YdcF family protein [Vicinamibacterales bacterium]|nr:ElyC/SanA/YdcF family protein [Vicinamibacterales bacterium]